MSLFAEQADGVTAKAVADKLGLDKSVGQRRAQAALTLGYLNNREERKGRPYKLVPGDPMPEDREVLPPPEALADGCTVAADSEGIDTPPPPSVVEGPDDPGDLA